MNSCNTLYGQLAAGLFGEEGCMLSSDCAVVDALQPCLGGDGKTLMFVNINCEPASVKETLCSLRFAAKVNQCETGAKGGARKHITEIPSSIDSNAAEASAKEVRQVEG